MISRSEPLIGLEGLKNIKESTIVIVGVGGLGSQTGLLLSRMRPKKLILVDNDIVEEHNLERQLLYLPSEIGQLKAELSAKKLKEFCDVNYFCETLTKENISRIITKDVSLVMDCVDNTTTRLLINDYCKERNIPWVHASVVQDIGMIAFFENKKSSENNYDEERFSCYRCFNEEKQGKKVHEIGVLSSAVSTIASIAVKVAIDFLAKKEVLNEILRINVSDYSIRKLTCKKNVCCKKKE
jgi:molybdopterin/thiamine biosynthesis adenylyltransferase